mmetsp:Transcript_32514/g.55402  ORF Transcript_32514/g.55402 Transcript_32514/m.55402 type:complete len:366 (-) Transcript_32514:1635-2732(-)
MVSRVKVVSISRIFCGKSVNLLCPGNDIKALSLRTNIILSCVDVCSNLLIRVAILLRLHKHGLVHILQSLSLHGISSLHNCLASTEEPVVNLSDVMDFLDRQSLFMHCLGNGKDTTVSGDLQLLQEIVHCLKPGLWLEASIGWVNHSNCLLEGLLHGTSNTHDFSNTLHGRTNVCGNSLELGHVPTGDLGYDVIQTGFEASLGLLRDGVLHLIKRNSKTELSSHKGKRVSSGLGGKSGRTRETGVHLNDAVLKGFWVKSILNVTFSNNAQMFDNPNGSLTKHVVLFIRHGLRRRHHNTVSSVNTQRIEVLHVTNSHAVVVHIPHHLILNLFPSQHTLLNENLRTCCQSLFGILTQVSLINANATT